MSQSENKKETPKKETKLESLKLDMADMSQKLETANNQISVLQRPKESLSMEDVKSNINTYGSWIYQGTMRASSSAPTHSPKNREEQFYLYLNGATIRLYVWVDGTWRYTALT